MKYTVYLLTCKDEEEAKLISKELLGRSLAACVKTLPVNSSYIWKGELCHEEEVLLLIESSSEVFETIEQLLDKIHSYDQYVLTEVEVSRTNSGVHNWIQENVKHGGTQL